MNHAFDFGPDDDLNALKRACSALARRLTAELPEGEYRDNVNILILCNDIYLALDPIQQKSREERGTFFRGQQAKDVLDYLKCVHAGIHQFVGQLGLEEEK